MDLLWKFLKPVSFSLIGKEVDFRVLEGDVVLWGFLALLVGVIFRLVSGYLSFCGGNLNWKERAYITLSGFPKATGKTTRNVHCRSFDCTFMILHFSLATKTDIVQAALGPVALDLARSQNPQNEQQLSLARNVLLISVLAIISTAPLGERY